MPRKTHKTFDRDSPRRTVKQVAMLDNVSEKTVRRAIEAGHLKVLRLGPGGRLVRIHPDDHAAYRRAFRE